MSTHPSIIILGAGGHGRVVLDVIRQSGKFTPIGFLDNNPTLHGRRVDGLPVLGGIGLIEQRAPGFSPAGASSNVSPHPVNECNAAVIAIGDNGVRRMIAETVEAAGLDLPAIIHPSAQIATNVTIGRGVVIAAGALVCAHSQIGDYAILNTGCIVDHESMIGTAVHVCPGVRLAGHVTLESGAFIGIGSTVIQNVRIGFEAIVGAGAVVTCNVDPMTTVVGVPAREIKSAPNADEFASLLTVSSKGATGPAAPGSASANATRLAPGLDTPPSRPIRFRDLTPLPTLDSTLDPRDPMYVSGR